MTWMFAVACSPLISLKKTKNAEAYNNITTDVVSPANEQTEAKWTQVEYLICYTALFRSIMTK